MAFGAFRTIWITLRASNYTARAFEALEKSMGRIISEEEQLRRKTIRNMGAVGLMFVAMGLTAVTAIMGIIQKSRYGERMLARFSKRVDKALGRLGDRLARALEPILNVVIGLLEFLTSIQLGEWLVIGATAALILVGALLAAALAINTLSTNLPLAIGNLKAFIGTIWGAVTALGAYVKLLLISNPWLIPVAIGAAAAGAAIVGKAAGAYQMGTAFVQKGGLAVLHGGEEIKSARESRHPSLIERKGPTKRVYQVRLDIKNLHTKADKEGMVKVIRDALRSVT